MTHKQIIYTHHALNRAELRGISRADVRFLIAKGEKSDLGGQVWKSTGYIGKREADVIYRERQNDILIITVEWVE